MSAQLFGLWFLHVAIRNSSVHSKLPLHKFEYANFDVIREINRLQIAEFRARWPGTILMLQDAERGAVEER